MNQNVFFSIIQLDASNFSCIILILLYIKTLGCFSTSLRKLQLRQLLLSRKIMLVRTPSRLLAGPIQTISRKLLLLLNLMLRPLSLSLLKLGDY